MGDTTSCKKHRSTGNASVGGASCIDKNSQDASVCDREREISFLTGT